MPSQGLMIGGGIGQGLIQGLQAFNDTRKTNIQQEKEDRSQKMQNAGLLLKAQEAGYNVDPETGTINQTDYGKEKQDTEIGLLKSHAGYWDSKANEKATPDPYKVGRLATALQKDLDPDASRTGNFGQVSSKVLQAQALKKLALDSGGNINNLPAAQQEEMAIGLARMLGGGGVATDSRIRALVPSSAVGNAQSLRSWLTNEPQGANQQAFTKYMMDTIDREHDLANQQLNDIRSRRLGAHHALKQMDPDTYNEILSRYGMIEGPKEPKKEEPQGLMSGPQVDPQIDAWAKQYNLDYGQASKILQSRGHGK